MGGTRTLTAITQAAIYCLTGALFASYADAMTLSPIAVRSYLGQNLVAEIDILNITPQEEDSLKAGIASAKVFADLAMGYTQSIGEAQIALLRRTAGTRFIQLRSARPIGEPFVDLVIEVSSIAATFVRPYRLLLDPPPLQEGPGPDPQLAGLGAEARHAAHPLSSPPEETLLAAPNAAQSPGGRNTYGPSQNIESSPKKARNTQSAPTSKPARIASTDYLKPAIRAEPARAIAVETAPAEGLFADPRKPDPSDSGAHAAMLASASQAAATPTPEAATPKLVLARTEPDFLSMALDSLAGVLKEFLVSLCTMVAAVGYLLWKGARKRKDQKKLPSMATGTSPKLWTTATERDKASYDVDPLDALVSKPWTQAENMVFADERDPIAEADVYLAYDKDEPAEEILRESLMQDPNRLAIYLKLAEIYTARYDTTNFAKCAEQVQALAGIDSADWAQIQSLAQSMEADKLGYQSTMTSTSQTAPKSGMLEFDISIFPSKADSTAPSSNPPAEPIRIATGCDPVLSFAPAEDGAAVGVTTQSKSALTFDRDALSLDLAANPSWQTQSISEQLEISMELAKSFIDHGDIPSTRSMPKDTMADGSDEQPKLVQAMVANLK